MDHVEFGDARLPSTFWTRVERSRNGCWHWTGRINQYGYGSYWVRGNNTQDAHRVAYTTLVEALAPKGHPDHKQVDHECHNRSKSCKGGNTCLHRRCVNPNHMTAKSGAENVAASPHTLGSINRVKTHCPQGHELSGENILWSKTGRTCRTCNRASARERERRIRAERIAAGWEPKHWALQRDHCVHGHAYTEENTYSDSTGHRRCVVCREAKNARRRVDRTQPRPGRPVQSHCKRGHLLDGDNLYVSPAGVRSCKACRAMSVERYAAKAAEGRRPASHKAECRNGHPMVEGNIYVAPNGSHSCRACRNAASRRRDAKKRGH